MLNIEADVLVVGAGPGGTTVAYELSKLGYNVILIDRYAIGEHIVCGEYIPELSEIIDIFPNEAKPFLERTYSFFRRELIVNKVKEVVVSVERSSKSLPFRGFVIDKSKLLTHIASLARDNDVKILEKATFTHGTREDDTTCKSKVKSKRYGEIIVKTRVVIGADHYPSAVARSYNIINKVKRNDIAYTVSQRLRYVNYPNDSIYMLFDKNIAPGGYAWIIPRGNQDYNVGLGVVGDYSRDILTYYKRFLKQRMFDDIKVLGNITGKTLPVSGLFNKIVYRRVFLIGDAAGTVMPTNGGGIFTAMMNSLILGRVIETYGFTSKSEELYEFLMSKTLGSILNFGLAIRRAAEKVMYKPKCFKLMFNLIPKPIVRDLIAGKKSLITQLLSSLRYI